MPKKREGDRLFIAAVAATVEAYRSLKGLGIAQADGALKKTIHCIFTEDLGLVKKSAH